MSSSSSKTFTEERFLALAATYSDMVDRELEQILTIGESIPNLHDGVMYSLGLDTDDPSIRGKRIRPVLCLMTAEALNAPVDNALPFACAIEMLHNFALVHDDIEDGDTIRRGRDATHVRYGLAHGVNIGDYMLAKVFSFLFRDPHNSLPVREQLTELMHLTLEHLFMGQAMDISARASRSITMADYEMIVVMKTGSYLAAPIMGGALIAGANEDVLEALTRYGRAIGPLFQVKDDLIDLTTGKGRGEIGNDLREGKRSYLVAATMETASDSDKARLFDILDRPREETTAEDVAWAVELFRREGAMDRAENYCGELRRRGLKVIEHLPDSLRALLETVIEVLLNRKS